mmetsp:Transcript_8766/g.18897  ORF Transcript_8766/g.18897 Transcript_8766/m.18897 type:complete len:224 (+) Transcript_8766:1724-2395(+)
MPLVNLVDDDVRQVLQRVPRLELAQQHARRAERQPRGGTHLGVPAHDVPDRGPAGIRLAPLEGHAGRHPGGGESTRLGDDYLGLPRGVFEYELGDLGGLSASRFSGHEHHPTASLHGAGHQRQELPLGLRRRQRPPGAFQRRGQLRKRLRRRGLEGTGVPERGPLRRPPERFPGRLLPPRGLLPRACPIGCGFVFFGLAAFVRLRFCTRPRFAVLRLQMRQQL